MKKLIFISFIICLVSVSWIQAQPIMGYTFESNTGTYADITGGTVLGSGLTGSIDNIAFIGSTTGITDKTTAPGFSIGFDFLYSNTLMNKFAVSTSGFIIVGKEEVTIDPDRSGFIFSSNTEGKLNVIGLAMGSANILADDNTEISYKVLGTSPNQILVIQYKNIGVGSWGTSIGSFNFQIRLHETSGKIEYIFKGWSNISQSSLWAYVGLKDDIGNLHLRTNVSSDWTSSSTANTYQSITWSSSSYPIDGLTYTFTPPAICETPTSQPSNLTFVPQSIQIEGSFTPTAADQYLTVMTESSTLSQLPGDGTTYTGGDSIGNGRVIAYDAETSFKTSNDLEGSKIFYFHTFAVNSYCMYGPKYNTTNPLTGQAATLPAIPKSLTVKDVSYQSATISVEANDNGNQVLIAITDIPSLSEYGDIQLSGNFGTPSGELNVGDEIPGGGKIVYKGSSNQDITISNLTENTIYHFRCWSVNTNDEYSSTMLNQSMITWAEVPYYPPFDKMPIYTVPFGWEAEGNNFRLEADFSLKCNINSGNATNGVVNSLTTPWILLASGTNRIVFNAVYTTWSRMAGTLPYNEWDERDILQIQVSNDGENFITIYTIDKNNVPPLADVNDLANFSIPFTEMNGEKVKIKIRWNTYMGGTVALTLHDFMVEEKPDCDYPVNLNVDEGSLLGNNALISWEARAEESSWEIRYRINGTDEWSTPVEVTENPYLFTTLPERSIIELQVRAKCSVSSSSPWSNSITFTTGWNVPFTETFDENELPAGWEYESGTIEEETSFCTGTWCYYYWRIEDNKAVIDYASSLRDWLILPRVDLGNGDVHYELQFDLSRQLAGATSIAETDSLVLVASTDSGKILGTNGIIKVWKSADGSFTAIGNNTHYTIDLSDYAGIVRFAFYAYSEGSGTEIISIDNISILYTCPPAENVTVENVTSNEAVVKWEGDAADWLVFVRKKGDTEEIFESQSDKQITLDGLELQTTYEVGITTLCADNDSAKVIIVEFTTLAADPCLEPVNIVVTASQNTAVIEWDGNASNYQIRFRETGSESWINRTSTTNEITLQNLDADKEYEYEIQAICSPAEGDQSEWTTTATFRTLVITCFAPTSIIVIPDLRSAIVNWQGDANDYELAYRKNGETEWITLTVTNARTEEIENLEASTAYQLRLRSMCGEDDISTWSATQSFTTSDIPACVIPTNLRAESITHNSVTLSWDADEANSSWGIRYRAGTGASLTYVNELTAKTYLLEGLSSNTTYLWSVKANCEENESLWASQETFTTTQETSLDITQNNALAVFLSNNILNVINPEKTFINWIKLYSANGTLLQYYDINASENVLIPLSIASQFIIVEVQGQGFNNTYKVVF